MVADTLSSFCFFFLYVMQYLPAIEFAGILQLLTWVLMLFAASACFHVPDAVFAWNWLCPHRQGMSLLFLSYM
jgi:hypothetical protein